MTKAKSKAAPKVEKANGEKGFFPIADFKKKVKMKLNGAEFFQSPLLLLRDSDLIESKPFNFTDEDNKPYVKDVEVCTYEGKGDVEGYAHQGGGSLSFSSKTG